MRSSLLLVPLFVACGAPAETHLSPGAKADTYGPDNRRDLCDLTAGSDPRLRGWARAVALVTAKSDLVTTPGGFLLQAKPLGERLFNTKVGSMFGLAPQRLCGTEPFVEQPSVPGCTAFLVGPDLIATAGHCLRRDPSYDPSYLLDEGWCATHAFVFDFARAGSNPTPLELSAEQVFECEEVQAFALVPGVEDFALVRLARVSGREHLRLRREGRATEGSRVATLGHPLGIPLKIDVGGEVVHVSAEENVFRTTLDTFYGNSGGPVINLDTGLIEGIHVEGPDSFVATESGCFKEAACESFDEDGVCYGSKELHAEVFAHLIPQ